MPFLEIKQDPFEEYGERWEGVGGRAEQAAGIAAVEAAEVLRETIQERSTEYDAFGPEITGEVDVLQDEQGRWKVGLPEDHPQNEAAREAEYGSVKDWRPPQALMRTSERRSRREAEQVLQETLVTELFGEG